jgi:hypothetical protein
MTKYILLLIIFISLSSCSNQKAYIVSSPNINCFKYEKEKNIKFAAQGLNYNLQTNVALNNKFGLTASLYGGLNINEINRSGIKLNFIGGEIGGIYYKYLTNHIYFESQLGYGYCDNNTDAGWASDPLSAMGLHGSSYFCETNTNYHKLFIQPCVFFIGKKKSLGLGLKVNSVYFVNYHYSFKNILVDGDTGSGYDTESGIEGETGFYNKLGFVFEPVINLKFKDVFYIQFIGALSNNIHNGISNEYVASGPTSVEHSFSNPQHIYFKINLGWEFKLGKNKKPIISE